MKKLTLICICLCSLTACNNEPDAAPEPLAGTQDSTMLVAADRAQEGEQYVAMLDSTLIEGNLVAQLPDDTRLRPMRIVDGRPAMILENGKIVAMAEGQTGPVTVSNGKMVMQLRDSSLKELSFRKDGLMVGGNYAADARMAVMMQGKMLDVTMKNGKSFVTLPDSTLMELRVNDGQSMLIAAADTLKSRATRLRLQNGTIQPVRLDSGKVRLQIQPDKVIEMKKKPTPEK